MCRKVTGALKITHERWKKDKATRAEKVPPAVRAEFAAAIRSNEQIEQHLSKARAAKHMAHSTSPAVLPP